MIRVIGFVADDVIPKAALSQIRTDLDVVRPKGSRQGKGRWLPNASFTFCNTNR